MPSLARASVMIARNQEFIEAARAVGAEAFPQESMIFEKENFGTADL